MNGMISDKSSTYLQHLPFIYQKDSEKGAFFGRFLKIFEKLLSGISDEVLIDERPVEGIEQVLDRIYEFFDPLLTQSEFLKWLAGWVALVLREDWDEVKKRRLLRRIVSLYRIRGTKKGLDEYIRIYITGCSVEFFEILAPFQIEKTSTIGEDTYLSGGPPHFFRVTLTLPEPTLEFPRYERSVRAIIDMEKPAHTYYHLKTIVPTMQIGVFSEIGKNTLLGDIPSFIL